MKAENYNPDFYKTLDELQEGAESKESYGKLKKIWDKLQSILESNSVSNISSIISTIISACLLLFIHICLVCKYYNVINI